MLTMFAQFWFIDSFFVFRQRMLRNRLFIEATIAPYQTLRHIREPLFNDYSTGGRFIGILFRILRILLGLLAYAVVTLLSLIAYFGWLLLPFLGVLAVIGSVVATV